jgi:hypothetical protein
VRPASCERGWTSRHNRSDRLNIAHAKGTHGGAGAIGPRIIELAIGCVFATCIDFWKMARRTGRCPQLVRLGLRPAKRHENRRGTIAPARAARSNRASGASEAEQLFDPERASLTESLGIEGPSCPTIARDSD